MTPSFIWITHGKYPAVKILDQFIPEPAARDVILNFYIESIFNFFIFL